jgi:hypothetical protein
VSPALTDFVTDSCTPPFGDTNMTIMIRMPIVVHSREDVQYLVAELPYRYCAENDLIVLVPDGGLAGDIEAWAKVVAPDPAKVYRY